MATIKIIDNKATSNRLMIGENTLHFMGLQNGLDDDGKAVIMDEAMHVLGQCIRPGINDNITNIAVGYVQSGKTLSFTTLTALAADNGWRVVVYLTGTKTNLQEQTSKRLQKDLDIDNTDTYRMYTDIIDSVSVVNNARNFLKLSDEVLLFPILKHYKHISRLANIFTQLRPELDGKGCIIIDDEADQSSFNTYAKKNSQSEEWEEDEFSKTYSSILDLKNSLPNHSYVQYTATPQAAFLIDNNDILSPKFHTVLTPGKGYTGGKEFFKNKDRDVVELIPDDQINDPKNPLTSLPATLIDALKEFLISVAIVVIIQKRMKFLSMMVHIDGRRASNEKFASWINEKTQEWMDFLTAPDGDPAKKFTINGFHEAYQKITKYMDGAPSFDETMQVMQRAIMLTQTHLVQGGDSDNDINWNSDKGHILVGADMLNRGFTIEKLSMTYMPRTSKSKATADTIEQRCRFFGYKSSYFDVCRVYLPAKSIVEYNDYVDHEETLRTSLKQCTSIAEFSQHSSSMLMAESLNPTRTNILSRKLVRTKLSGWRGLRSLFCIEENKTVCKQFLANWNDTDFKLFKDYDGNILRNHRYIKCDIDKFVKFFKQIKYGDVPNITRKIVTLQYLAYLKESQNIQYIYVFEMAFGAKEVKDLRYRSLVDGESKPNNLMAGRAANGSYDGDEKICFDDAVCVQLHHIRIEQPLNKLHNKDLYNLEFYYPNSVANSFVGLEDNEDYE